MSKGRQTILNVSDELLQQRACCFYGDIELVAHCDAVFQGDDNFAERLGLGIYGLELQ